MSKIISKTHTKSTIIGCIYKHSKLSISNLSNTFLQPLLDKIYENKNIIFPSDFNIDLFYKRFFILCILWVFIPYKLQYQQEKHLVPSKLIDNIWTNTVNESLVSGNLTFSIPDHFAQFLTQPKITINDTEKKRNRNFKNAIWTHL